MYFNPRAKALGQKYHSFPPRASLSHLGAEKAYSPGAKIVFSTWIGTEKRVSCTTMSENHESFSYEKLTIELFMLRNLCNELIFAAENEMIVLTFFENIAWSLSEKI